MTRPLTPRKRLFAPAFVGLACLTLSVLDVLGVEFHDVKYFFDNVEEFRGDIPRSGITEKVAVRGKLVTHMAPVQCAKGPCPPVTAFGFQDVDNENYRFHIFETNKLLRRLKVNSVYVLGGVLEKSIDVGHKRVFISSFDPKTIISSAASALDKPEATRPSNQRFEAVAQEQRAAQDFR